MIVMGNVDEDVKNTYYLDDDGDGFGVLKTSTTEVFVMYLLDTLKKIRIAWTRIRCIPG